MKICIVTPSFVGGGAERIAVNLANQYVKEGNQVTLLVFSGFGPYKDQISSSVQVVDLGVKRVRYVLFPLFFALRRLEPDAILPVIRNANIFVGFVGLVLRKNRYVFREASTMDAIASMPPLRRFVYKALMRLTYSRAKWIIANSDDTKKDLILHKIASEQRIVVIGNPVLPPDYEKLTLEPVSHPWLSDPKFKTVLTVGRLHKLKNQAMLINAFSKVSSVIEDLRLIILGEGEEHGNLQNLAEQLGIYEKIDIVPFQKNPYPFYKHADVFVLTSDWEGFGNVLVESMACRTLVISTNCSGGPRSILDNGQFGSLVPVGNIDALVKALQRAFTENSESILNIAKNRANDFSVEKISNEYLVLIHPDV